MIAFTTGGLAWNQQMDASAALMYESIFSGLGFYFGVQLCCFLLVRKIYELLVFLAPAVRTASKKVKGAIMSVLMAAISTPCAAWYNDFQSEIDGFAHCESRLPLCVRLCSRANRERNRDRKGTPY